MRAKGCHRRANLLSPRLLESYCPDCGLLIAASPWPNVLSKLERIHTCPVRGHYKAGSSTPKPPQPVQRAPARAGKKIAPALAVNSVIPGIAPGKRRVAAPPLTVVPLGPTLGSSLSRKKHKPGSRVPLTGIYRVYHESHRLMHEAALLADTIFPCCKQCGLAVRFELCALLEAKKVVPFRPGAILIECVTKGRSPQRPAL
jgi:hypothetical protein